MLRHNCPRLRAAFACAVVGLVVAAPSGALARETSGDDAATRAALATERYWSTYEIDDSLPAPHHAAAKGDDATTKTAVVAVVVGVALALSASALVLVRRRSIKPI